LRAGPEESDINQKWNATSTRHPLEEGLMMKIKYKGYRIWAILQTNGKYRACFLKSAVTGDAKANINPVIEGDNQTEAIAKAKEFLDGIPELNWSWQRTGSI
jgi:hypothetical protein